MQISDSVYNICGELADKGYIRIPADAIPLDDHLRSAWDDLRTDYDRLDPDQFLPDGARYRFRRYDSFYFLPVTGELHLLPHRDYFQDTSINAVTGGIIRKFAPLLPETVDNPFLQELIRFNFAHFPLRDAAQQYEAWQVDVHEILVVAEPGEDAHPTPEGIHRDGAEFVTVHLAVLENAEGGLVSVYDDSRQHIESFTLNHLLDSYLFDDAQLWHGVTPIESADGINPARRGILTFDYHHRPDLQRPE